MGDINNNQNLGHLDAFWTKVDTLSSEEIENVRIDCLKELQGFEDQHYVIKDEYSQLGREIITLEAKRYDLKRVIDKSTYNIKKLKNEIQRLEAKFWQHKKL